ncbi:response regulator [Natrinema salaciae]|uniref:PAS domain S-box-containing protein n=1 Tax=Natrinema salaciae TaxID=1186196 RepID=A0A1H9MN56_9EURY|nr:response regulator [Natrinema salaciae]SER25140.1 PAS domain S-box-containing protein [Natrinema salaciae]
MSPGIHVLYVDDDPDIRELSATVLERTSDEFDVTTAGSGREGLALLDDGLGVDCIVSDYQMLELDGLEFFDAVRDRDPDVPFLLVTGTRPSEIASEAIDAGVTDYLRKGAVTGTAQCTVLANRIEHAVEKRRLERARDEIDRQLERYRVLVENAADPMYTLDENGTVTMVNDAMVDWIGYDRDRLVGSAIETVLTDDTVECATDALRRMTEAETPAPACFEWTFEASDGRRRVSQTTVAPLRTGDGEFAGSAGVVRERT